MDNYLQIFVFLLLGVVLAAAALFLFYVGLTDQSTTLLTKLVIAVIAIMLASMSYIAFRAFSNQLEN